MTSLLKKLFKKFLRGFRKCRNIKEACNKIENKTNFFIMREHEFRISKNDFYFMLNYFLNSPILLQKFFALI